jgi:hypothetical protein
MKTAPLLQERTIDDLAIDDEASFRHVALYADLKEVLRRAAYRFRVLPESAYARWDRALLLNLTFWGGASSGGDVLMESRVPADVVAHAAWHHLAARALGVSAGGASSADALFLGEAIASAFDVYLVGRLLASPHASSGSSFLETQVPAMAEAAEAAGVGEDDFEILLADIARDPDRAFEDLRQLLYDATRALRSATDAGEAFAALARFDGHRFAPLLHRYELSNWVLYARAYAAPGPPLSASSPAAPSPADAIDRTLRGQPSPLDWLATAWVRPAIS